MIDFREEISKAVDCLTNGGIIIYPTDTIWGIGCDATNKEAVQRIYSLKKRTDSKSMLVLLDNDVKLRNFVKDVPDIAYDLAELSEKPLTIIYDGAQNLAQNLLAEDGSVGIRITREAFSKNLCARFKKPIVSTSANFSGEPSPSIFSEISKEILEAADYIVNYRRNDNTKAKPSGIIKIKSTGEVKIIRE